MVHRHILLPKSAGFVGVIEGRGIKLGFSFPIDPLEDSDHAMERIYSMQEPMAMFLIF